MAASSDLAQRYAQIKERVARAARRAGRKPDDILLVAVTKFAEPEQIRELVHLGHRDFGENRVQQLIQRASMLEEYLARHRVLVHTPHPVIAGGSLIDADNRRGTERLPVVRWHMIGHLQRNKARKVVEFCRLIHSVDSLRLAEELQTIALRRDQPIEVLLQVNCSEEATKFGCAAAAAPHLAEQIDTMVYVRLRGLMTMAPLCDDPERARPAFSRCRELFEEIRAAGVGEGRFNILSMGMSNDFEVAIEEGANLVRIGTAIFGSPATIAPPADDD